MYPLNSDQPYPINQWYVAAWSHEVNRELFERKILGQSLVMYRTLAGTAVALDNACHTQLLAEAAGTPQPIDEAVAQHTHSQIGGPEGALHAFESLYEGLVEAEPELLE